LSNRNSLSKHGEDVLALLEESARSNQSDWDKFAGEIAAMSLVEFCEQYLFIQDINDNLVPFVPNRAQRDLEGKLERYKRIVGLKGRQQGISTFCVAFLFKRSLERGARSMSMAHDDDTTQKLRRMAKIFYDNLPEHLQLERTQDNAAITSYSNLAEVTIKTAGSKIGGRGGTYGGVFLADEAAFWKDADQVFKGAIQGVPESGIIVMVSTANGTQGLFYNEVQKAKSGDSEYHFVFYEWWWEDRYSIPLEDGETLNYSDDEQALVDKHGLSPEQIKWRRKKMNEPGMGEDFFQEYPEDPDTCFLTSGESAFPGVHSVMVAPTQTKPIQGHVYSAALDWGQDNDYSSLCIMDETEKREVYLNRWRKMKYQEIRAEVVQACIFWTCTRIKPEANSMSSNIEELIDDFAAEGYEIDVTPLNMSNPLKHELVTLFKNGYQAGGMKLLDIAYAKQEMNTFVKKQLPSLIWTYQAECKGSRNDKANARDDTVIARLLAWHNVMDQSEIDIAFPEY